MIAAVHQRQSEGAMADQERAEEGCDWAKDRKLVACSSAAEIAPLFAVETLSPKSTEKWSGVPIAPVSVTSRFARSSAATTSGSA